MSTIGALPPRKAARLPERNNETVLRNENIVNYRGKDCRRPYVRSNVGVAGAMSPGIGRYLHLSAHQCSEGQTGRRPKYRIAAPMRSSWILTKGAFVAGS